MKDAPRVQMTAGYLKALSASNAAVRLRRLDARYWDLTVEAGGERVSVHLEVRNGQILAHTQFSPAGSGAAA